MKDLFGYLIGPKAENMELFRQLVIEALDDHMYWRRNFHPEDYPVVTSATQSDADFKAFVDGLRDRLFQFLSHSKAGVPFFSARYVGHMNTDLLLPALVGYFGAMLYNSNNVADESSPVTARLEKEVIEMLLKMVGLPPEGWGYLTTGGTTANIYSLWVARNLRTLPFSIRIALECDTLPDDIIAENLKEHDIAIKGSLHLRLKKIQEELKKNLKSMTAIGEEKPISEMSAWELANLPVEELCQLRQTALVYIKETIDSQKPIDSPEIVKEAGFFFDELVRHFQLKTLGLQSFRKLANQHIRDAGSILDSVWKIYVSASSHYSWPKSADILGFGNKSISLIPLLSSFDMDVSAFRDIILKDLNDQTSEKVWPFFLSSIFGTTEEGALDNLPAIYELLEEFRLEHGLTIWNHVDACYGGYLASMIRPELGSSSVAKAGDSNTPGTLKNWLLECGTGVGLPQDECRELIDMSDQGTGTWLAWQEFIDRTAALNRSDSISIDPHKLGYIPYPAGAVLLKNGHAREVMSTDAPYLWADSETDIGFTGRYTLEGSRSGAAAAACWLAHKTVPLDQNGHGRLVGLSVLSARKLYQSLKDEFRGPNKDGQIALIHQPHSNIVCYVPYHKELSSIEETNRITTEIIKKLSPTREIRNFMAVGTEVMLSSKATIEEGLREHSPFKKMLGENEKIKVIRSVVMGPYSLIAQTRGGSFQKEKISTFEAYSQYLSQLVDETVKEYYEKTANDKAKTWQRHMVSLIMDDDASTPSQIRNCLPTLHNDKFWKHFQYKETEKAAMGMVKDYNVPLDIAFLDIDMRGSSSEPKGESDSGFKVYEAIHERNIIVNEEYRVKVVFFFTKGYRDYKKRIKDAKAKYPDVDIKTIKLNRNATSENATEEQRRLVADQILKELIGLKI
ncbi:pyridoxal phosphate-dependent decarboxylase family protein [Desulfobacula sp.]|uniref:Pyridoxal-dependent decarboxylase n=1 Tax=Candidatus Desulfatibia vada TaxID=2841696 RepID=A0A8J6P150_9BACT|nr:hypothetical protein [Candidatus Desulfatibia vada]MBL6994162.1 hypothetical protein [Desulfobacula sp.]